MTQLAIKERKCGVPKTLLYIRSLGVLRYVRDDGLRLLLKYLVTRYTSGAFCEVSWSVCTSSLPPLCPDTFERQCLARLCWSGGRCTQSVTLGPCKARRIDTALEHAPLCVDPDSLFSRSVREPE